MINLILCIVLAELFERKVGFISPPQKQCFWIIIVLDELFALQNLVPDNVKSILLRRLLHIGVSCHFLKH